MRNTTRLTGRASKLQVPLVIHWPGTPAQEIATLTDNKDVMTTLMQRLLHVSTPANEYSQGRSVQRRAPPTGSPRPTAIRWPSPPRPDRGAEPQRHLYHLEPRRREIKDQKPQLSLLLQVLTDEKRFIAN
jgi:membrane-anchored protein YejM (alkaline phosphatase superfamily)